jgi:hypothetical protein
VDPDETTAKKASALHYIAYHTVLHLLAVLRIRDVCSSRIPDPIFSLYCILYELARLCIFLLYCGKNPKFRAFLYRIKFLNFYLFRFCDFGIRAPW